MDEAIAIRADQVAGKPVDLFRAALALKIIKAAAKKAPRKLYRDRVPMKLLKMLIGGPIERAEFYEKANELGSPREAVRRLRDDGLIRDEIRLTEDGLRALGLQGPRT